MKYAVVGSRPRLRKHNHREFTQGTVKRHEACRQWIRDNMTMDDTLISGGANGVDTVAETTCEGLAIGCMIFYPKWQTHGRAAGFIRNREMVENADKVVVFWDGKSKGTKSTIDLAKKAGKLWHLQIVEEEGDD